MSIPRFSKLIWTLALIALLGLVGCAGVYAPTGPHPARLEVMAQAEVTAQQIRDTLERKVRLAPLAFVTRGEVGPPLWDLRAFLPAPDGGLIPLQPVKPVANLETHRLEASAEFLAPPGVQQVVFLLECSVRHESYEGPHPMVEYVYIVSRRVDLRLDLPAGGKLTVSPFAARP